MCQTGGSTKRDYGLIQQCTYVLTVGHGCDLPWQIFGGFPKMCWWWWRFAITETSSRWGTMVPISWGCIADSLVLESWIGLYISPFPLRFRECKRWRTFRWHHIPQLQFQAWDLYEKYNVPFPCSISLTGMCSQCFLMTFLLAFLIFYYADVLHSLTLYKYTFCTTFHFCCSQKCVSQTQWLPVWMKQKHNEGNSPNVLVLKRSQTNLAKLHETEPCLP